MRRFGRAMSWRKFLLALLVATATGASAYVVLFPQYVMTRTQDALTARNVEDGIEPYNELRHARDLLGPDYRTVVKPNNDTLYSTTFVDLAHGPQLLRVPPTGERYWSVELLDMTSRILGVVSRRTHGGEGTDILLVPPGWDGAAPDDMAMVEFNGRKGWLILRYLIDGPRDLGRVHALQNATVLEAWEPPPAPAEGP